jgi:hypothetical protein
VVLRVGSPGLCMAVMTTNDPRTLSDPKVLMHTSRPTPARRQRDCVGRILDARPPTAPDEAE